MRLALRPPTQRCSRSPADATGRLRLMRGAAAILLLLVGLAGCAGNGQEGGDRREASRINTELGIAYARKNMLELAQEKLQRALDQDDDNAVAHATLAFVLGQRGELVLAERHYRRALALNPDDANVRNNFGVFLCARGKLKEAEDYFLDAARDRRYPTPEAAWTNAGVCFKNRDANKAEQYFREAVRVNPNFPDALAQLASLAYMKGDYLRARAFIQRFEQSGRLSPEMLLLAARTETALGDPAAARQYQTRLKREFPASPEAAESQNLVAHEP